MDYTCKKKRWFETRAFARRKIRKLKQLNKHVKLETYQCRTCGGWHITSKVSMAYKIKNRGKR